MVSWYPTIYLSISIYYRSQGVSPSTAKVTEAAVAKWAADQRFPLDTLTRVTGLLRRIHRHEQAHRATPEAKSELCRACAATAGDLQALK